MHAAVYYPNTMVRNEQLLKRSLLLWDQLDFIVPYNTTANGSAWLSQYTASAFSDGRDSLDAKQTAKQFAEAVELIGAHTPVSDEEKEAAHERITEFAASRLPDTFYYFENSRRSHHASGLDHYEIYPQKLLDKTWHMLEKLQLAGNQLANQDYPLSQPAGLSLMAILADCRAGDLRARVTDEGLAYATLANIAVDVSTSVQALQERVVPITLELLDISDIPLRKLIDLRKLEGKEGGHRLRKLRSVART